MLTIYQTGTLPFEKNAHTAMLIWLFWLQQLLDSSVYNIKLRFVFKRSWIFSDAMYFKIVSGSFSISDCGLEKKRRVENASKLFIRLVLSDFSADFTSIIIQPFVMLTLPLYSAQSCQIGVVLYIFKTLRFRKCVQQKTLQDKADWYAN